MKKKQSGEVIFRQASNETNQVYIFPWIMDVIIFTEINFEILGYQKKKQNSINNSKERKGYEKLYFCLANLL